MFALAVALGCDIFDSAAYALFARQERYLTESGTTRLKDMQYFPCSCPVCNRTDPKTVRELPKEERLKLLAEHNLHVSFCELKTVKEAIVEGRLWEHMQQRAHGHPSLMQALKQVTKYGKQLEKQSQLTKRSGLFFFSSLGLARPEVVRYRNRLLERYSPPKKASTLLLLPQTGTSPFHTSKEHNAVMTVVKENLGDDTDLLHVCTYTAPFGVVPTELDDIYPISQNEIASPFDAETLVDVAKQASEYIKKTQYRHVVLLREPKVWKGKMLAACRRACKKKQIPFTAIHERDPWAESTVECLAAVVRDAVTSI
jgi:7-cyano-7-deazaguanine tRNA-ribosyltransferase